GAAHGRSGKTHLDWLSDYQRHP
ncbi:hypothetical protein ACTFIV_009582, partial [Dictyostelium citrinum]